MTSYLSMHTTSAGEGYFVYVGNSPFKNLDQGLRIFRIDLEDGSVINVSIHDYAI